MGAASVRSWLGHSRIDELAATADSQARLEAAVRELPTAQHDAVLARVVEERLYAEIAERMACSEMVVRQRVSRGLKALRTQMEELRCVASLRSSRVSFRPRRRPRHRVHGRVCAHGGAGSGPGRG